MNDFFCLPFSTHPLRDAMYDELHARPFHVISTPQQITHLAFKAEPTELEEAFDLMCDLCRRYSVNQPAREAVSYLQDFGKFSVRWERHMEFYALTIMRPELPKDDPFRDPVIELLPGDWLASLPGQAVATFHVAVDGGQLSLEQEDLSRYFEGQKLILSRPKEGRALLVTAFKLHGDGFGRFLLHTPGDSDQQIGRLVQRVIEIETYRLLAQLSLPVAKRMAPQLADMDQQLAEILSRTPQINSSEDEREMLRRLSSMAAHLETCRAETNNRFAATKAYHELVLSRLNNIREQAVNGHMTAAEFMSRRLAPGLRTCESVQRWMEDLSRRIERAGDMLRTRVNLTLQEQNKFLLATMNRRSRLQFRLQETVEGLSVVAISYYLVGLLGYFFAGLPLEEWHLSKKVLMAVSVPLVLILIWRLTHHIKHRLIKEPEHQE